jgi:hypothetical protein
MDNHQTFVEAWQTHGAELHDIDDWVDAWHKGGSGVSLAQWLGFTKAQYMGWVLEPDCLLQILETTACLSCGCRPCLC